MSQENISVGSGPMTVKRSLNNILAALNIAQGKGAYTLRESAFIFTSLQKLNEFVNKYEKQDLLPVANVANLLPEVKQTLKITDNDKENKQPFAELTTQVEEANLEETIEI